MILFDFVIIYHKVILIEHTIYLVKMCKLIY